jgi:acyl-CoA synthetase (AMP-forming)/AMP-acid ligase II
MPTAVNTLRADFFSIPELLESRAQELPESFEIVGVPDRHFNLQRYTYKQLDDASTRLAHHYTNSGLITPRRSGDATSQLVVALMAPSSFEYVVTELALVKMGT